MELSVGEVVILDDNKKYAVAGVVNYLDSNYCYIVSLDDYDDTKICLYNNGVLTLVEDEELLNELEDMFMENM